MGKFILFSLNLIFLVAYKFFFGGDVEVVQNFPSQVAAGEKFTVEVNITKGEREGFAKWQQELPQGLIATAGETAGATFSFKKNTVKLIWMALPEDDNFTITYEIATDPNLNANLELSGKFSYIEENERKDIITPAKKISIGAGGPALAAAKTPAKTEEKTAEEKKPTESEETKAAEPQAVLAEKKSSPTPSATPKGGITLKNTVANTEDVMVERSIKVMDNGQYVVSLIIDKKNFDSFGKVEEYIPEGYKASELNNDNGMFSFNNNVMKILWMALPPKSTLEVSYKLESTNDDLDSAIVHGVFSFLRGEESVQLAMKGMRFPNTFSVEEEEEVMEEEKQEEMIVEEPIAAISQEEKVESNTEKLEKEITSVPAPETSVSYRVQIAAGKKEVGPKYFATRHGIKESITTDYHNTWYKYMIGSFGVYKEARDRRNQIWAADNKINDAFVTAYNSGERISVQEALMITKQKWYK